MAGTTIDIESIIDPHTLAVEIANRWSSWNSSRSSKLEEWKELRNYIYATDTRTTSNNKLPSGLKLQIQHQMLRLNETSYKHTWRTS